jgi:hypothetical protein
MEHPAKIIGVEPPVRREVRLSLKSVSNVPEMTARMLRTVVRRFQPLIKCA